MHIVTRCLLIFSSSRDRSSSPEFDATRPVLRLSAETRYRILIVVPVFFFFLLIRGVFLFDRVIHAPTALDLSEPEDPDLQVMQARFMEI